MSRNKGRKPKNNNNNKSKEEDHDRIVEQWKIRKLIKKLSEARGNGTSMISLIIPPSGQISHVTNMLMQEHGTASNIKSRVNRLSVLSAITSTRERLKLYHRLPPNGLVLYCGTVITDEGKERKMSIHFEPFKPVTTSLYLCDNKFHVEHLQSLLEEDSVFGFIIVDGNGCLFGTLSGNHCQVKQKFSVELPKKHGRGGQSAVRFARLRMEARHNYVRKCAEMATMNFITGDRANVEGIVLAGSASFKHQLNKSDLFDLRLKQIVIKVVDTSYGGENGFNQAIELSKESLADVKFVHEKKVLADFLQEIAMDSDKYSFGIRDTMRALEMSAVKTIIVWDDLELIRYKLRNPSTKETKEVYIDKKEAEDNSFLKDEETGVLWDVVEQQEVLEWMAENYKKFGTSLEFVTDRSPEGAQFVKGFGGIGAFLRWKINWAEIDDYFEINEEDDDAWI